MAIQPVNLLYWARQGAISNRPPDEREATRIGAAHRGQALVVFAIFFTVILGAAALVLDQALLRKANMDLQNAVDSGALAGVAFVDTDAAKAESTARKYVQLNYPGGLPDADVDVSFRCIIGVDEYGAPRVSDVPLACDPGSNPTWKVDGERAYAGCTPSLGHVCNTIVVGGPATVDYNFAPVLGVFEGSTGARSAAACKGACGEPPEIPVDLIMILDRTNSMSGVDTANAMLAADDVRRSLDPRVQWIGLSLLHRSMTQGNCLTKPDNSNPWYANAPADLRTWVPIGLTGTGATFDSDYSHDGSTLHVGISCIDNSSGQGTDLADPVRMATYELETYGRPEATKAILLLSDGKPTNSADPAVRTTKNYCADAVAAASAAKAKGIEIYAVGFGLDVVSNH
ncbi:MAG: VWA domain-containing protein, partial [Chloroflexota bacterium]